MGRWYEFVEMSELSQGTDRNVKIVILSQSVTGVAFKKKDGLYGYDPIVCPGSSQSSTNAFPLWNSSDSHSKGVTEIQNIFQVVFQENSWKYEDVETNHKTASSRIPLKDSDDSFRFGPILADYYKYIHHIKKKGSYAGELKNKKIKYASMKTFLT